MGNEQWGSFEVCLIVLRAAEMHQMHGNIFQLK